MVAWALKKAALKFIPLVKVDHFVERIGITTVLAQGGIKDSPTNLAGRILFRFVVIVFSTVALSTLDVAAIETLLAKFFLYLPNIFLALLIVIAGFTLSDFMETAVLVASVSAGIQFSGFLGKGVKILFRRITAL